MYDFDKEIDRLNTSCSKWDGLEKRFGTTDVLPLWVADMDFAAPESVTKAIAERAAHPVFGYPIREADYYDSFITWEKNLNDFDVKREWLDYVPGVVCGIACALQAFTVPGDGVLIMPPVYHPFRNTINAQGRHVINSPLHYRNGRFEIDFEDLDKKAADARVLLLCSPHNPTGRVFSRDEMNRIEAICRKHNLLVISDEIHSDLVYSHASHIPFPMVSEWAREHSVTLMAPSKTFNVAGLVASIYIVPNPDMKRHMDHIVKECMHIGGGNIFGLIAADAAYAGGREWYDDLMTYLQGNIDFLDNGLKKRVPQVKLVIPEATYIPLIDCRELNLPGEKLQEFMLNEVRAAMNEGELFGREGEGFCRINIGTQRKNLAEFITRLENAVKKL